MRKNRLVIFVQDSAQLKKITSNVNYQSALIVWYQGNKISNIQSCAGKRYSVFNITNIIFSMIRADEFVCEYANFIPRVLSIIFNKRLHAHVFGVLTKSSFETDRRIKLCGKWNTQHADVYSIYGENNQTKKLHKYLSSIAKVEYKLRKDIHDLSHLAESEYILFISQPWKELGYLRYSKIEQKVYNCLISNGYEVVVCVHPRGPSVNGIVYRNHVHGYEDAIKYIEDNGRPLCALTLSSSMAQELNQMGVSAATMLEGDFMDRKEDCEVKTTNLYNLHKLSHSLLSCLDIVK